MWAMGHYEPQDDSAYIIRNPLGSTVVLACLRIRSKLQPQEITIVKVARALLLAARVRSNLDRLPVESRTRVKMPFALHEWETTTL